jgi:hypothetical protein
MSGRVEVRITIAFRVAKLMGASIYDVIHGTALPPRAIWRQSLITAGDRDRSRWPLPRCCTPLAGLAVLAFGAAPQGRDGGPAASMAARRHRWRPGGMGCRAGGIGWRSGGMGWRPGGIGWRPGGMGCRPGGIGGRPR